MDLRLRSCYIINNNLYYIHTENLFMCMLTDARKEIRLKAVKMILEYRECNNNNVLVFIKPKVNFNVNEYFNLITDDMWLESTTHYISKYTYIEYLNSYIITFKKK